MELPFSPSAMQGASTPSTCFNCQRLNSTTFIIIEDDKWRESPLIYVKIYSSVVVLIDTGCGGASRDPDVQLHSLRRFIETYPVAANGSEPLNPSGERDYVVICTHCHYDHIGTLRDLFFDNITLLKKTGL
jgi:glyoxylase-like metal-dependent hydrolase (beta-lactamase superfamily II)